MVDRLGHGLRCALYWHNGGHGLGHTSRSGTLGQALLGRLPGSSVVGITGAREGLDLLPHGMDFVKVPSYTSREKAGAVNRSPVLAVSDQQLHRMRSRIMVTFLADLEPHVLFTDLYPLGKRNELADALARVPDTKVVFGVRGLLDDTVLHPGTGFFDSRTIDIVGERFAAIHVYTDPQIFRLEDHYDLPRSWEQKVTYTGYVARRPAAASREEARTLLGLDTGARIIVVSFGAGTGKEDMWQAIVGHLHSIRSRFDIAYMAAGINLEQDAYDRIASLVAADPALVWTRALHDLPTWMMASDLFIGTGGYNTCAEVLSAGVNAVVIASEKYDLEEEISTEAMASRQLVRKGRRVELDQPEMRVMLERGLDDPYPGPDAPAILTDGAVRNAELAQAIVAGSI